MRNYPTLAAEERAGSRNQLKRIRDSLVPAKMFGDEQQTLSLEVNRLALQSVIAHGAENSMVLLSVGNRPTVQALIRHVQYDSISGKIAHIDFYVVRTADLEESSRVA